MAMVEDHPELKTQRDVTDPKAEADTPDIDQDPTVDQIQGVLTASSSVEKTRYNREVRKHSNQFKDVALLTKQMRQIQAERQRSSQN